MKTYKDKLNYFESHVLPGLEEAFKRGDEKYKGNRYSHSDHCINRSGAEDIRHVRDCHVSVRLLEAEDFADTEHFIDAVNKIESAIGYLIILHSRILNKIKD